MSPVTASELAVERFFHGLAVPHLDELAVSARTVRFPPDSRIFGEGGAADRFWLLRYGRAAIDLTVPGRGQIIIETVGPGDVLGWSWLFPPYEWDFGATVLDAPLTAVEFDARLVQVMCETDPVLGHELHRRFSAVLLERLQATRVRLLDIYGQLGEPS